MSKKSIPEASETGAAANTAQTGTPASEKKAATPEGSSEVEAATVNATTANDSSETKTAANTSTVEHTVETAAKPKPGESPKEPSAQDAKTVEPATSNEFDETRLLRIGEIAQGIMSGSDPTRLGALFGILAELDGRFEKIAERLNVYAEVKSAKYDFTTPELCNAASKDLFDRQFENLIFLIRKCGVVVTGPYLDEGSDAVMRLSTEHHPNVLFHGLSTKISVLKENQQSALQRLRDFLKMYIALNEIFSIEKGEAQSALFALTDISIQTDNGKNYVIVKVHDSATNDSFDVACTQEAAGGFICKAYERLALQSLIKSQHLLKKNGFAVKIHDDGEGKRQWEITIDPYMTVPAHLKPLLNERHNFDKDCLAKTKNIITEIAEFIKTSNPSKG